MVAYARGWRRPCGVTRSRWCRPSLRSGRLSLGMDRRSSPLWPRNTSAPQRPPAARRTDSCRNRRSGGGSPHLEHTPRSHPSAARLPPPRMFRNRPADIYLLAYIPVAAHKRRTRSYIPARVRTATWRCTRRRWRRRSPSSAARRALAQGQGRTTLSVRPLALRAPMPARGPLDDVYRPWSSPSPRPPSRSCSAPCSLRDIVKEARHGDNRPHRPRLDEALWVSLARRSDRRGGAEGGGKAGRRSVRQLFALARRTRRRGRERPR